MACLGNCPLTRRFVIFGLLAKAGYRFILVRRLETSGGEPRWQSAYVAISRLLCHGAQASPIPISYSIELPTERNLPMKRKVVWLKDAPTEFPYLTERYLRRLVQERRIRSYRVGRKVYLVRDDLEALLVEVPATAGGGW